MNYIQIFISFIIGGLLCSGAVLAESDKYGPGTIFDTPDFLIEQMDDEYKDMSNLDYWGTRNQEPTQAPPTYLNYINEGWAYLESGSNKDAEKSFDKAIDLNQTSNEAWYGKGLALENQKRYLSAVDAFENSLAFSKKPVSNWGPNAGLGRIYLPLQQFEKSKEACMLAISQYEQAGESSSEELSSIYKTLAQALEKLGDTEGAQEALDNANQLNK